MSSNIEYNTNSVLQNWIWNKQNTVHQCQSQSIWNHNFGSTKFTNNNNVISIEWNKNISNDMNVVIINITTKQKRKETQMTQTRRIGKNGIKTTNKKKQFRNKKISKIISAAETAVKGIAKIRTAISKESDDIIGKNATNSASCHWQTTFIRAW